MKKILTTIIAILLAINITYAQSFDHLEPIHGVFGVHFGYYSEIHNILFNGISGFQAVQFIIFPSFGSESILAIEYDTTDLKNMKYNLAYNKSNTNIYKWMQGKRSKKIIVDKYRKKISVESVYHVEKLFNVAIKQARYPKRVGLDGVRYYFGTLLGYNAGALRSPDKGTKMAELVAISYEIVKLAKNENNYIEFDEDLIKRIENLTNRLNEFADSLSW